MNKPKILGTTWETAVVKYLREHGFPEAERRALSGQNDLGDVINAVHTYECKATRSIDLAGGIEELKNEIANAQTKYGFLIIKRRMKSTGEAYAVMELKQLCDMLQDIQNG